VSFLWGRRGRAQAGSSRQNVGEGNSPVKKLNFRIGKVPDQAVRIGTVFIVFIVSMVALRQHFIPESFGVLGHYRANAIPVIAGLPLHYAGWQTCGECHEDELDKKMAGFHRTLSCETCHGPSYEHAVVDPTATKPNLPRGRETCLTCHGYLPSRPTGFPQIIELQHNPMESCLKCHNPHSPAAAEDKPSCSGCHGAIARTKALSHHSLLPCETCHQTPAEHKESPRQNLPRKPTSREFCGQCHAEGTPVSGTLLGVDLSSREIPKVDLATHGNNYLCWQCHYPHYPEGK